MEKNYRLKIWETSYLDDYKEGEVEKTSQIIDLTNHNQYFNSPEEALQAFADEYGDGKMYKVDNGDGTAFFAFNSTKKSTIHGWEDLTKDEEQLWRNGELKAYNVEWCAQIIKEETIDQVDLNAIPFPIMDA